MRVAIIGHGPSVLSAEMGEDIDNHDFVVRLKRCQETLKHPKQYGQRIDAVCGSLTIAAELRKIPAGQYWVFTDSRHQDIKVNEWAYREHFSPRPVIIDHELCDDWNERYRQLRDKRKFPAHVEMKPSSTEDLGENHLSAGLHAVLFASKHQNPKSISLFGFDNVFTGDYGWSITRGPDWVKYPPHRWDIEHDLLTDISKEFDTEIQFIFPEARND